MLVACRRGGGDRGVVEEAEDASGGALGGVVSGSEEVGGDLVVIVLAVSSPFVGNFVIK